MFCQEFIHHMKHMVHVLYNRIVRNAKVIIVIAITWGLS